MSVNDGLKEGDSQVRQAAVMRTYAQHLCGNEASLAWDGATLRTIGAVGFLYDRRFGGERIE
jgi:hypothetical protein